MDRGLTDEFWVQGNRIRLLCMFNGREWNGVKAGCGSQLIRDIVFF